MSEYIEQIMKKYNVNFEEALKIIERQDAIISFIFNSFHPYGKYRH